MKEPKVTIKQLKLTEGSSYLILTEDKTKGVTLALLDKTTTNSEGNYIRILQRGIVELLINGRELVLDAGIHGIQRDSKGEDFGDLALLPPEGNA